MSLEAWRYLGQFNETHHRISRCVYYCHSHRLRTLAIWYGGWIVKLEKPTFLMILGMAFVFVILYFAGVGAWHFAKGFGWVY